MKGVIFIAAVLFSLMFGVPLLGALLFKPLAEKAYYAEIQSNREEEENGGANFE